MVLYVHMKLIGNYKALLCISASINGRVKSCQNILQEKIILNREENLAANNFTLNIASFSPES